MAKAIALINKLKRRNKYLNKNKGFRRQDKIDRRDEVMKDSPKAYNAMRKIMRDLQKSFGEQFLPSPKEGSQQMLLLADLAAQAAVSPVAGVAAFFTGQVLGMTTDVTITADNEGTAGNSISLSFDGVEDIDAALLAWNTANPSNTASLTAGDGSQVPDNLEVIDLDGGVDEVKEIPLSTAMEVEAGQLRASGLAAGDVVQILQGELMGQELEVLAVDYDLDTAYLEDVSLAAPESAYCKLQLGDVKKSYK